MKKASRAGKAGSSDLFLQRVSGKIRHDQYVRGLDQRVAERQKDAAKHRRKK